MTGLITTSGRQWEDWSAEYKFLSQERFDPGVVFGAVRRGVVGHLAPDAPLVVAMDDTTTRKAGRKIPGAAWKRDPLGPPFHTNFVWGRRFLQISALAPAGREDAPGRAIPIDLLSMRRARRSPRPRPPPKPGTPIARRPGPPASGGRRRAGSRC